MNPRFWYRASDDQYILLTEDIERPIVDVVRRCAFVFIIVCTILEIMAAIAFVFIIVCTLLEIMAAIGGVP